MFYPFILCLIFITAKICEGIIRDVIASFMKFILNIFVRSVINTMTKEKSFPITAFLPSAFHSAPGIPQPCSQP